MLSERAALVALELAERLKDPSRIAEIVGRQPNYHWSPLSLAKGFPGTVLLFSELDRRFPSEGWDSTAHLHLLAMQEAMEKEGIGDLSLFSGLTGIAFAVRSASRGGSRYRRFLEQLDGFLANEMKEIEIGSFDLIRGSCGIGCYLLSSGQEGLEALVEEVLSRMVRLSQPLKVGEDWVPGWYQGGDDRYPEGHFDCGISHGAAGPLALLCLADKMGFSVPGQRGAIETMAEWLLRWKQGDEFGVFWPEKISLREEVSGDSPKSRPRAAWCYGNPGISRALGLAAESLERPEIGEIAHDGYLSMFLRPQEGWDVLSPTFCHGKAGMLHAAERAAIAGVENQVRALSSQLLELFEPSSPFGYQDIVRPDFQTSDKVGLLDGTVGIALTLLDGDKPTWDRPFLLSALS